MANATQLLSVIIVSYNTREVTLKCLETLYASLQGIQAEVFVVDNASNDKTMEAVGDRYPLVRRIANDCNRGFGAANNQALREATGNFILLLNSDAFPQPSTVRTLLAYIELHPDVGIVGPRVLNADGSLQLSCYRFPSPFRAFCENTLLTAAFPNHPLLGDYRARAHDTVRGVDFVIGACMLVRRKAIEQVGLFDEDFFLYAEETDWTYRFYRAGWKCAFVPDARVTHLNGASGTSHSDKVFNEFRHAQERYMRKHHGSAGLWFFRATLIFGACLRIALLAAANYLSFLPNKSARHGIAEWQRTLLWNLGVRGERLSKL